MTEKVHLAVALDRAGWHPAAWRDPSARPHELTSPRYWRTLLQTADRARIVLATIEDALAITDRFERSAAPGQSDGERGAAAQTPGHGDADGIRRDRVRGRLDAVLVASYAAPATQRIGLVPTVTPTHPEPFHIATGIQTLDFASRGRAGVRLVAGASAAERANFGRRPVGVDALPASGRVEDSPEILAAFGEAGDVAEALGRLWDSWEDDAIIRDAARAGSAIATACTAPDSRGSSSPPTSRTSTADSRPGATRAARPSAEPRGGQRGRRYSAATRLPLRDGAAARGRPGQ